MKEASDLVHFFSMKKILVGIVLLYVRKKERKKVEQESLFFSLNMIPEEGRKLYRSKGRVNKNNQGGV